MGPRPRRARSSSRGPVGSVSQVTSARRVVLDTSCVIAGDVAPIPGVLAISVITVAELQFGVLKTNDPAVRAERLRRVSLLQRQFDPLPVDDGVSVAYGQCAAAVAAIGRRPQPRSLDLLIAATAMAHEASLLTRNPDDFRGLEHLVEVLTP